MNLPNKLATLRMVLVIPFVLAMDSALKIEMTNDNHVNGLSISMIIIAIIIFAIIFIYSLFKNKKGK